MDTLRASRDLILKVVSIALGLALIVIGASAQTLSPSQPPQHRMPQPVPLRHLYWHFLIYQHLLDARAAQEEAQGLDGSQLHDHLQNLLGFSETDYAPVRQASEQLASEISDLAAQAAAIRASGYSSSTSTQLKALAEQREAYIGAEILALKEALPPDKITALETFMTQFFAPKKLTFQVTAH